MGARMKYIVTLKRKETLNAAQNARQKRVEVYADSERKAKDAALDYGNWRYFVVDSVRRCYERPIRINRRG